MLNPQHSAPFGHFWPDQLRFPGFAAALQLFDEFVPRRDVAAVSGGAGVHSSAGAGVQAAAWPCIEAAAGAGVEPATRADVHASTRAGVKAAARARVHSSARPCRSEEHTSELQSRGHLV